MEARSENDTVERALASAPAGGRSPRPWAAYIHVPFCLRRCGYCDFNTYAPADLPGAGASLAEYPQVLAAELDLLVRVLPPRPPLDTVFLGGGTPTMLSARELAGVLEALRTRFGLAADAEVTTEANPDTVDAAYFAELARAGFTRVSLGMQSSVPHVLATLDRTHRAENVERAVAGARAAGLAVSLDLIYGTPGESLGDWERSLGAAIELAPDHVSAYALTVERGTALGARVRRGELPMPQDDDEADKYEVADRLLGEAGYGWYEISNWARREQDRCRHNLGYWQGGEWLAAGPGAHALVAGVRWWDHKLPRAWAAAVSAGRVPAAGVERLDDEQRYAERVMLGIRTADGLGLTGLHPAGREAVPGLVRSGLLDREAAELEQVARLTLRGRLLADTAVRALLAF